MTKIQLNENELIQIVEAAAKNALSKILNEGAGWDTIKQSFKSGIKGDKWMDGKGENPAKNYIKNGDGTNYNEFKHNRDFDNRARNVHKNKQSILKNKKNDPSSYTVNDIDKSQHQVDIAKERRNAAADDTVGSRPGIIGKGQRAANVAAYRAGKGVKKAKDAVTNFVHDKIGLEENKKK